MYYTRQRIGDKGFPDEISLLVNSIYAAIILAAGMGRRLGELTGNNTKCMLEVNGIKLIDRALGCLAEHGITQVVLVIGYKGENVRNYIGNQYRGMKIVYVENSVYDKTNNIYSLYLAKE